jgi:hypothetical protein
MSGAAPATGGFVKLISSDKHIFILERRVASVSGRLRVLFSGAGVEASKGEVSLDFPANVLEKVVQYFVRWFGRGGGEGMQMGLGELSCCVARAPTHRSRPPTLRFRSTTR